MSALRGFVVGGLALTGLYAAVTSPVLDSSTSGVVKIATGFINRLVDPTIPLIPNRANYNPSGSTGSSVLNDVGGGVLGELGFI